MIEIYAPYLYLIIFCVLVIGSFSGYLLGGGLADGSSVDTNQFNVLLKEEKGKRELVEKELALEIEHGKLLEKANEDLFEQSESAKKTFAEMHKHHNKILIDPESNTQKIPETKLFKRRRLGGKLRRQKIGQRLSQICHVFCYAGRSSITNGIILYSY